MHDVSVRPSTIDDLDSIWKIESEAHAAPWAREAFHMELEKKFHHFWVLTDDETDKEIYAYIIFSFPDNVAHILNLATAKKLRRQGYATHLIRAVINYILRNGGNSVMLEVRITNDAALHLYQGLGFVIMQKKLSFYANGEDAYVMNFRLRAVGETSGYE